MLEDKFDKFSGMIGIMGAILNDAVVDLKNSIEFIDTLDLPEQEKEIFRKLIPLLIENNTLAWKELIIGMVVNARNNAPDTYNYEMFNALITKALNDLEKHIFYTGKSALNYLYPQLTSAKTIEEFDRDLLFLRSSFNIEQDKNKLLLDELIDKMKTTSDSRCMRVVSEYLNLGPQDGAVMAIWTYFPSLVNANNNGLSGDDIEISR